MRIPLRGQAEYLHQRVPCQCYLKSFARTFAEIKFASNFKANCSAFLVHLHFENGRFDGRRGELRGRSRCPADVERRPTDRKSAVAGAALAARRRGDTRPAKAEADLCSVSSKTVLTSGSWTKMTHGPMELARSRPNLKINQRTRGSHNGFAVSVKKSCADVFTVIM